MARTMLYTYIDEVIGHVIYNYNVSTVKASGIVRVFAHECQMNIVDLIYCNLYLRLMKSNVWDSKRVV